MLTFALAILSVHVLRLKYPYANRPHSSGYSPGSLTAPDPKCRKRASHIQPHTNHTAIHSWPILLNGHSCHWYLSELYIYILYKTKVGVGPMFTFYISPKMRKNLLSQPNHLYHHSFQIRAGPDFLTPPFLDDPVRLARPLSCYFLYATLPQRD